MAESGAPDRELLPSASSGVEDLSAGRRALRVLVAVALTLGLSAVAACSGGSADPVPPSPGIDTGGTGQIISTPTPTVSVSPGPGVTEPGIKLVAVPHTDGSFDVTEDLILPEATNILQLQVPSSGEHLPGLMVKTTPRATNLKLVAENMSVPLEDTTLTSTADVPLTTAATKIRLTYRLMGSAVRATPSAEGRAGAAIRPLTATSDGTLPTDLTVTTGLLNAVCPLMTDTRCAVGDPPALGILPNIPASKALVVLQLNLPH